MYRATLESCTTSTCLFVGIPRPLGAHNQIPVTAVSVCRSLFVLLLAMLLVPSSLSAQTQVSLTVSQSSSQYPGTPGTGTGSAKCPNTVINTSATVTVTLPSQYGSIAQALADGYFFIGTGIGSGAGTSYQNGDRCDPTPATVGPETYSVRFGRTTLDIQGIPQNIGIGAVAPTVWSISTGALSYNGPYIQSSGGPQVGSISFSINGPIGRLADIVSLTITQSSSQYPGTPGTGTGGASCPNTVINTSASLPVILPSRYANIAQALADDYSFIGTGIGSGAGTSYQNGDRCDATPATVGPETYSVRFSKNTVAIQGIPNNIGIGAVNPSSVWPVSPTAITYNGPYFQQMGGPQVGNISFSINGNIGHTSCNVNPTDIAVTSAGPFSASGQPTGMLAVFIPTTNGTPVSLSTAATACGFTGFDWQQTIEVLPGPSDPAKCNFFSSMPRCAAAAINPSIVLTAPPPFLDPVPGGYTYQLPTGDNSYPFYYSPLDVAGGCAVKDLAKGTCIFQITTDNGNALNFWDAPASPLLPLGQYVEFKTSLVGVLPGNIPGPPLYSWTWVSNYNGTSGGTATTKNLAVVDLGGTGGVTIKGINGVPQTPPSVTCSASPTTLWLPNDTPVLVTVSGTVILGTQAIPAGGTTYAVKDEYGQVQPSGSFAPGTGGGYSLGVPLIAARNGYDLDGRTYTITIRVSDKVGNVGSCSAVVTVPHDQGH